MSQDLWSSRLLAPAGVILALAVAFGVWVAPTGWLDPRAPAAPEKDPSALVSEPGPIGNATVIRPEWDVVEDAMAFVREPIVGEDPEGPEPDPTPTPNGTPDPDATTRSTIQLGWVYLGIAENDSRSAALVRIENAQRFLLDGDTVTDERHGEITVLRIDPEKLTVRVDDEEIEIARAGKDATPPATTRQAEKPTGRARRR